MVPASTRVRQPGSQRLAPPMHTAPHLLIDDETFGRLRAGRYLGWNDDLGRSILGGEVSLADLADRAAGVGAPEGRSGDQERAENLVAAVIDRVR